MNAPFIPYRIVVVAILGLATVSATVSAAEKEDPGLNRDTPPWILDDGDDAGWDRVEMERNRLLEQRVTIESGEKGITLLQLLNVIRKQTHIDFVISGKTAGITVFINITDKTIFSVLNCVTRAADDEIAWTMEPTEKIITVFRVPHDNADQDMDEPDDAGDNAMNEPDALDDEPDPDRPAPEAPKPDAGPKQNAGDNF